MNENGGIINYYRGELRRERKRKARAEQITAVHNREHASTLERDSGPFQVQHARSVSSTK